MSARGMLPDCATCFYGNTKRCGGHTTANRQALKEELRGEHEGIGCRGDPGPMFRFLHLHPHPNAESASLPKLPVFIPQIATSGLNSTPHYPSGMNTFAISLTTLFSPHGKLCWTDKTALRNALCLPLDARLLVVGTGDDRLLEKIWNRMIDDDVWRKMAALDLAASTGFSFSVWDVQPRMDQIINQERNFLTCRYLSAHGIPTIPIVFWYDKYDFQNLAQWLRQRCITTVAVLNQFIREYERFEQLCEEMKWLQEEVESTLHYVVIGVGRPRRISRLLSDFSCSIITKQPFAVAVHSGCRVTQDLDRETVLDQARSRDELVAENVTNYWNFCTQCIGRTSQTPIQLSLLNPFSDAGSTTPHLGSTT